MEDKTFASMLPELSLVNRPFYVVGPPRPYWSHGAERCVLNLLKSTTVSASHSPRLTLREREHFLLPPLSQFHFLAH